MKQDWEKSIAQLEKLREKHVKNILRLTEFTWNYQARKDIERANNRIVEIQAVIQAKRDQQQLL